MRLDSKSSESSANWSRVPLCARHFHPFWEPQGHLADLRQQGPLLGWAARRVAPSLDGTGVWALPQPSSLCPSPRRISLASSKALPSWFSQASTPIASHRHFFQQHLCTFSVILTSASQKAQKNTHVASSDPQAALGGQCRLHFREEKRQRTCSPTGRRLLSKGQGKAPNCFHYFFLSNIDFSPL